MSDSFKGTGRTDVQPGTVNKPVYLRLKAATASTKNDGSMPYGSTVISAVVTAHHGRTNTDYSTSLITSSTESANTIIAYLSYSTALPRGLYHITATVTMSLSGASTTYSEEYDLQRIEVRDR
jgi:hypothetical protein